MMKPKIRFNGFTDDWEQRKLSELVQIERGGSPRPIEAYITDAPNGLNWVKIGDAPVQGHYITKTAEKIKPEGLSKTRQVQPGDLILSNSMSFGKPYIMGIDGCIHDGWLLIRDNKKAFDLTFLYHLLGTPQMLSQYKSLAAGSTVNNLNKELVGGTIVTIPNLDEQQVLGQYLESLDNLITLHQRKYNLCNKVKVYAWEQRKLEEIYQNIGNAFVGTATPYYVDTGHFYLESNNIKDGQINRNNEVFINDEFYERQKDKWLHTGDMVMVQSGHVGHTAVIPEELDNSAAHALIMFRNPKIEIEPYFLNYQYQTIKSKRKINNITTGNTIKHILASDMYNFIVDVSDIEEQQQIANYFLELDHLITLHQRKKKYTKKPIILLKITF